ncbi:helix-turn-helix transcriptional regulator [Bacillus toyonensis]|uniref:helix-turn-helix domain-containing protein n=1 Tax=Bacillus cereus group TaxID=86661 RepID=UPI000CD9EE00|nr:MULTISPECIES: helix-turn-helix transcriptional regulator [Bacillus cereus group]MEB4819580.1 helix-turn-helix transcriptional regulator [Bacillus thuringiensis]MED3541743.1 helix-turn-helix transcriptional regulator [Bacillus toyonensis]MEE2021554.1 helix-turn-helix transcriptional regulator [Bacillus toyonensis]
MKHKIKEVRKKNGDTLKTLANKINYDYSNLSKIERGIYNPSLTLLQKIADIYAVDIKYLLGLEQEDKRLLDENQFIRDIDLNSTDLLKKYSLMLDGKPATNDEVELVIQVIRKLRETLQKQK